MTGRTPEVPTPLHQGSEASEPAAASPGGSLRSRSFAGAAWMFLREGGGIAVRLVGVLALTRLLGPADFGLYAGALAVVTVLATVAQLNSEVFLLRRPHAPTPREVGTVYTLLLLSGGALSLLALAGAMGASALGVDEDYVGPFRLMLVGLLLNVLWAPAQAALERSFRYRSLGMLELSGDVVLYAVAVPLAVAGFGAYAPAAGYVAWQAYLLVGSCLLARTGLRPRWDAGTSRDVLRFAVAFSPVTLLPRLGDLINPVVVGALVGPVGVGYVALAVRLLQTVGFVGRTAYRIALVVLAKISDDVPRLTRAFRQGLGLQALGVGVPYAGLCIASPWLVPLAFGAEWRPALEVLPYLALTALFGDLFFLHSHVITVSGRLRVLAQSFLLNLALRVALTLALLPVLGLPGFGVAAMLSLVSLVPLHRGVAAVFPPDYREALPWLVGFAPLMFLPLLEEPVSLVLTLPLLVGLSLRKPRAQLRRHVDEVLAALRGRAGAPTSA